MLHEGMNDARMPSAIAGGRQAEGMLMCIPKISCSQQGRACAMGGSGEAFAFAMRLQQVMQRVNRDPAHGATAGAPLETAISTLPRLAFRSDDAQ